MALSTSLPWFVTVIAQRILCWFLTALLLFAESGQTVYAHTCLKQNKTTYSLTAETSCKKESSRPCCARRHQMQTGIKAAGCCVITAKYIKQNFQAEEVTAPVHTETVAVLHTVALPLLYAPAQAPTLPVCHLSPPYGTVHLPVKQLRI